MVVCKLCFYKTVSIYPCLSEQRLRISRKVAEKVTPEPWEDGLEKDFSNRGMSRSSLRNDQEKD